LFGITQVSWYQNGKANVDFTVTRDNEWQWRQLCYIASISLQTDNQAIDPVFYRPDALPSAQPTATKH